MFGSGIDQLKIIHWPGKEKTTADALSRNPVTDTFSITDLDTIVSTVESIGDATFVTTKYADH